MRVKITNIVPILFILNACTSNGLSINSHPQPICQGFGCIDKPGKLPSSIENHKATKDEKIRVRRGENPNFGSDEISIRGPSISF
ncbi:hypothetical protein ACV1BL_25240 (plasmid) [Serratia marcescens]